MDIVAANRRRGRANGLARMAGAAVNIARQANDMGFFKDAQKVYKQLSANRAKSRAERNKPKQQTVNQRSTKTAAPTSFGISSNDVVRAVVQKSTSTMSRMTGVSYLGPVIAPSVVGSLPQVATFCSSNPVTFQDRLQIHASTYDKYVYNSVKLRYVPAIGTSIAGKVAIAIDRDYTDPPQTATWGETISYESVASGTVWSEHSCSMKRDPSEKRSYFTNLASGVDSRETEQFKFYAYVQGVAASTFCGDLYLEYDINLVSPVYAPSELAVALNTSSTNYVQSTCTNSSASSIWTMAGLPIEDGSRDVYEVIFSIPPSTAGITLFNATGAAWTPPVTGSYRLFARGNSPTTRTVTLHLDYASALANIAPLFQTAALGGTLFTLSTVAYRRITYTSAAA